RNGPTSQPGSLEDALAQVIAVHTEQGQQPRATLELHGAERSLSQGVQHALRRVLQEALTNVQRHANASAVQVALALESERVTMEVCDDGRGRVQQPNGPCRTVGPGSALGPCSAVGPGSAVGENRAVGEGSAHQGYG